MLMPMHRRLGTSAVLALLLLWPMVLPALPSAITTDSIDPIFDLAPVGDHDQVFLAKYSSRYGLKSRYRVMA